jgi:hypothetical protein
VPGCGSALVQALGFRCQWCCDRGPWYRFHQCYHHCCCYRCRYPHLLPGFLAVLVVRMSGAALATRPTAEEHLHRRVPMLNCSAAQMCAARCKNLAMSLPIWSCIQPRHCNCTWNTTRGGPKFAPYTSSNSRRSRGSIVLHLRKKVVYTANTGCVVPSRPPSSHPSLGVACVLPYNPLPHTLLVCACVLRRRW